MTKKQEGLLLIANWDSDVGYAWWLMESYWVALSKLYDGILKSHLTYPSISKIPEHIAREDIVIHEFNFLSRDLVSIIRQIRFIRKNKIRTVYLTDFPPYSVRYFLFRLAGVRTIYVHDHSPGERVVPKGFARVLKSTVMRLPILRANFAIGATNFVKYRLESVACFPKGTAFSAPNGIIYDKEKYSQKINLFTQYGIPSDKVVMVTTGRAHHYKGIPFVLKCLKNMKSRGELNDLHYLFCGDGPHLEEFQQIINEYELEDVVTFAGQCDNVPAILAACDFAIHPSKGEVGYSLSILEYMAAELPVIVPDNPSVCGATQDEVTGIVYPRDNIKSACFAIGRLAESKKLRREMGKAARAIVSQDYSLAQTHACFIEIFKETDELLKF